MNQYNKSGYLSGDQMRLSAWK